MNALPGGAGGLLLAAVAAALIGGLAAVERKGALQLMLSRPIVLSPLLGWALGDAEGGLFLGIPLELIFLGGVNLGGSLPDNETLVAAAVTSAVVPAGMMAGTGVDAALAALALALLYPLARAGKRLERAAERRNAALSDKALARAAGGDAGAVWLNLRGLFLPFAVTASICRARAAERHLEFFNCHPYLAAAIVGGAVRLEEEVARGAADPRTVSAFKAALGPPFAALGDGFFWLALRPTAALIAAVTEPYLGVWCVALFLAIYDGVHLAARAWLFFAGYRRGEGIVAAVSHAHLPQIIGFLKGSAAILAGGIAGRSVVVAGLPHRPWHAVLIAVLIVALAAPLPRIGLTAALYTAMALGLALGGGFL